MGSSHIFVPQEFLDKASEELADTFDSLTTRIGSEIARLATILSTEEDIIRLMRMEAIYVSNQGKLLAFSEENEKFYQVDTVGNGDIPLDAMFLAPYTCFRDLMGSMSRGTARGWLKPTDDNCTTGELSTTLSKYIFPLDEDAIHIQFRLPEPSFRLFDSKLKVVFGNNGGGNDGEYCLAACNDGTVKWLRQSQCRNGNHVWTVHLFDPPSEPEGEVHLCQRLRRRGSVADNNYVNVINNHNFGGNRNQSGSQIIGTINSRTDLNLHLPDTNVQRRGN